MLASSRIGADEDINDYEGKTEEEINELIAAKVKLEKLRGNVSFFCLPNELIYTIVIRMHFVRQRRRSTSSLPPRFQ
jgi:hypothetical protein